MEHKIHISESCKECRFCKRMEDGCYYCTINNKIIVDISLRKYFCPQKSLLHTHTYSCNIENC